MYGLTDQDVPLKVSLIYSEKTQLVMNSFNLIQGYS